MKLCSELEGNPMWLELGYLPNDSEALDFVMGCVRR
jgi:hypothetical protein